MAQVQDVNDFIQAVIQAVAQMPPPPPVAQPAPPAPPAPPGPFALFPGQAIQVPLDFTKAEDRKTFRTATLGTMNKFDMKEEHLRVFLDRVQERVRHYDWQGVVMVPDANGVQRDLLTHYGQVTIDDVRAHAQGYVGAQNRDAQNSIMLQQFLANSLTDDAHLMMVSASELYLVNGTPVGALFLKALIGRASIDTRAKVLLLRESISHLYLKMNELKGNVREFNQYVSEHVAALSGRGHTVDELVTHLFRAYEQVPDAHFGRYIESVRDRYDAEIEDYTATQLMQLAVNKYDLLVQRNAMPTEDNSEKTVALETQVKQLKGKQGKGKNGKKKKYDKDAYAWKLIPPTNGELNKVVNKKTYNWCPHHKAWTIHSPAQCKMSGGTEGRTPDGDRLVINQAYRAMVIDDDDDDSQE
jgi:hypothetical protein